MNPTWATNLILCFRMLIIYHDRKSIPFKSRGIKEPIISYVPDYDEATKGVWLNRRQEIELFLEEFKPKNYLILDDDKSLSGASEEIKANWIQTYMSIGLKGIE